MIIFLIIFLIYFLIKLLLEILNKHSIVTFTIGQDYAWYNWLSLINILFSLAFVVTSYFIASVNFFQFTMMERILSGIVLLDVLFEQNILYYTKETLCYTSIVFVSDMAVGDQSSILIYVFFDIVLLLEYSLVLNFECLDFLIRRK